MQFSDPMRSWKMSAFQWIPGRNQSCLRLRF